MNIKAFWVACAFSLLAAPAFAEEAEITIDIIEEQSGDPGQLMNRIELPEAASIEAGKNSRFGLDAANDAREKGQQKGVDAATEFREVINLGREISLPEELSGSDMKQLGTEIPQPPSVPETP